MLGKHLPRIDKMLKKLDDTTPETYGNGNEYWDGTFALNLSGNLLILF